MINSTNINQIFKKKIFNNLKKNKSNYFSDGKIKIFYKDINEQFLELKNFLKKKRYWKKKNFSSNL